MKRSFCLILFVLFFNIVSFCQTEKDSIEASILKFFDGFSEIDANKFKAYTTNDFILLENGHVWNMDTLVNKMSASKMQA